MEEFAVAADKGPGEAFGAGGFGALQLAEEHARDPRVGGDESDVGEKHRLKGGERRGGGLGGLRDPREQLLGNPLHDRLKDALLGREVLEESGLGDAHAFGDRGGGDVAGVLAGGEGDDSFLGGGAAAFGGLVLGVADHGAQSK